VNKLFRINKISSNERAACWLELIIAMSIFLSVLVLRYTPAGRFFFCVFHKTTNLPCVFCGITRSLHQCMLLNFAPALNFHLLGPLLFFVLILRGSYNLFCVTVGYSLSSNFVSKKNKKIIFFTIIIFSIFYWILRLFKVGYFELPS